MYIFLNSDDGCLIYKILFFFVFVEKPRCYLLKEWKNVLESLGDKFLLPVLTSMICDYLFPCEHAIPTMNLPLWKRKCMVGGSVRSTEWLYGRRGCIVYWTESTICVYRGVFDTTTHWSEIGSHVILHPQTKDKLILGVNYVKNILTATTDFPQTEPVFFLMNRQRGRRAWHAPDRPYYILWIHRGENNNDENDKGHDYDDNDYPSLAFRKYLLLSDYDKAIFHPKHEPFLNHVGNV